MRLLILALVAGALPAQTYTFTFRQTAQADGSVLTEPFQGEPPTTLIQPLATTWNETCLQSSGGERYKQVTLTYGSAGALSVTEQDLTPGGQTMTVAIAPLTPPAGFVTLGILVEQGAAAPLFFATAAAAAEWIVKSWPAGQACRTVRLRWVAAKSYPRTDMTPNEWHVATAHWPVSATVTVGP